MAAQADAGRSPSPPAQHIEYRAQVQPAPKVHLSPSTYGLGPPEGNSPAFWSRDGAPYLHVLTNNGRKTLRLSAPASNRWDSAWQTVPVDLPRSVVGREPALYIEAVERDDEGILFGWYHLEIETCGVKGDEPPCDLRGLMAPAIGMAISTDDGKHWIDRGLILTGEAAPCSTWNGNGNFNGGNGDFCVVLDPSHRFLFFYFTNYFGEPEEHGIALARMPWSARGEIPPSRFVEKWFGGAWSEAGLGGRASAIIPAAVAWDEPDYESYWGPAVHYNTYLDALVMILNHTTGAGGDACWPSRNEKIYIAYCPDPSHPAVWTGPVPLVSPVLGRTRYPQLLGTGPGETDRMVGRTARLFLHGTSTWLITFFRQAPNGPARR